MSSRSSSQASATRNDDPLLPFSNNELEKPRIRLRTYLRNFFNRRIVLGLIASLVLVSVVVFSTHDVSVYDVAAPYLSSGKLDKQTEVEVPQPESTPPLIQEEESPTIVEEEQPIEGAVEESDEFEESDEGDAEETDELAQSDEWDTEDDDDGEDNHDVQDEDDVEMTDEEKEDAEARKNYEQDLKGTPWLRFKHLDGYFHGLKTLVSKANHFPEYPNTTREAPLPQPPKIENVPKPRVYNPYSDTSIVQCFLDENSTIPVPDIYAYDGMPQHMPDPSLGSYDVLGLKDDICFDRFGRYGPYGLGYSEQMGGAGVGADTEQSGSEEVWSQTGQIDYSEMDWAEAQNRCYAANRDRFHEVDPETEQVTSNGNMTRTAVVIRAYTGFKWTQHAILNFRAMISELSLKSGGAYSVHFLLHVRDGSIPIWSDDITVQRLLNSNIPPEFHGLVTLWSEDQMKLFYPGKFGEAYSNPSGANIHGVYRSAHLPLQVFAQDHPEYDHFWNWEMDMRYVGNFYELFEKMGNWADQQPRQQIWERAARYYIPSYHGDWENFTAATKEQMAESERSPTFGPLKFYGRKSLRFEQQKLPVMPAGCDSLEERHTCGVGEAADIITLNPIFDTDQSGWVFGLDATGYSSSPPPRRAAIITASRLSKRLLYAMHEEVWRHHHTMFSEMFPASVAFHHGFKGVYAPHPVFLDRAWNPIGEAIDGAFNAGWDHSTSGSGSPFDIRNEHNHKGSSFYYNSEFSGLLWRRWLGYAQIDGRGKYGGRGGEGEMRGGRDEEESEEGTGRMCLRSILLHPIKHEEPAE